MIRHQDIDKAIVVYVYKIQLMGGISGQYPVKQSFIGFVGENPLIVHQQLDYAVGVFVAPDHGSDDNIKVAVIIEIDYFRRHVMRESTFPSQSAITWDPS